MTTGSSRTLGLLAAATVTALLSWPARAQEPSEPALGELSPALLQQIAALVAEKAQRTPAQRKVSSRLLHAHQMQASRSPPGWCCVNRWSSRAGW